MRTAPLGSLSLTAASTPSRAHARPSAVTPSTGSLNASVSVQRPLFFGLKPPGVAASAARQPNEGGAWHRSVASAPSVTTEKGIEEDGSASASLATSPVASLEMKSRLKSASPPPRPSAAANGSSDSNRSAAATTGLSRRSLADSASGAGTFRTSAAHIAEPPPLSSARA